MIGFLRGKLVAKQAPALLIDVSGVGYELDVPMSTFFHLPVVGAEIMLYTHLTIREDAHTLFGFLTESERALFRSLIRVSGVGAKLALGILSGLSVEEFRRSVRTGDTAALVRLPGIGKKTAERLIIEMRDRLPDGASPGGVSIGPAIAGEAGVVQEAISALIALGFKPQEAGAMVRGLPSEGKNAEELLRQALQGAAR